MYNKRQSYDAWFLRHGDWRKECFVILDHFLLFYSPNNLKNQHFKKMKKTHGNMIILHRCTINDNYIMCVSKYGAWRTEFLSFWAIFCPFNYLITRNVKILKLKKKTHSDIIILHKCTKNHNNMLHCSWDMARNGCNCYFSFWAILCPFTSLTASKIKI